MNAILDDGERSEEEDEVRAVTGTISA